MSLLSQDAAVRAIEIDALAAMETLLRMIRTERPMAEIDAFRAVVHGQIDMEKVDPVMQALMDRATPLMMAFWPEAGEA